MGNRVWVLWGLVLAASPALATTMCANATLASYIGQNSSGGCQLGNAIFSNFQYNDVVSGGDPNDPVVPNTDVMISTGGPLTSPSLTFTTVNLAWQATGGFHNQITLSYTVTALGSSPIQGSSTELSGTVQNLGGLPSSVSGVYDFFFNSTETSQSGMLVPSDCGAGATTCADTGSSGSGLGPTTQVTIGDLITLDSGGSNGSSPNEATLTQLQQTVSESPEPSTMAATGLGLLAGWFAMRRLRG